MTTIQQKKIGRPIKPFNIEELKAPIRRRVGRPSKEDEIEDIAEKERYLNERKEKKRQIMNKYLSKGDNRIKNRIIQTIRRHRDTLTDEQVEQIKNTEDKRQAFKDLFFMTHTFSKL